MDLDKCIETVLKCQLLKEKELKYLCKIAQNILLEENNLQPVQSPVIVRFYFLKLDLWRYSWSIL